MISLPAFAYTPPSGIPVPAHVAVPVAGRATYFDDLVEELAAPQVTSSGGNPASQVPVFGSRAAVTDGLLRVPSGAVAEAAIPRAADSIEDTSGSADLGLPIFASTRVSETEAQVGSAASAAVVASATPATLSQADLPAKTSSLFKPNPVAADALSAATPATETGVLSEPTRASKPETPVVASADQVSVPGAHPVNTSRQTQLVEPVQLKTKSVSEPATPVVFTRATAPAVDTTEPQAAALGASLAGGSVSTQLVVPVRFKANPASELTPVVSSRSTALTEDFAKTAAPTQRIVPVQFKPNSAANLSTPVVFSGAIAAPESGAAKTTELTRSVVQEAANEPVQFKPNPASEPTSVVFSRATAPTEDLAKTAVPTQLIVPTQFRLNPVANPSTPTVISRATAAPESGAAKATEATSSAVSAAADELVQFKPNSASEPKSVVFSRATAPTEDFAKTAALTQLIFSRATAASGPDVAKTSESTRSVVPAAADEPVQFKPDPTSEPASVVFSRATAPTEDLAKTTVPTQLIAPTQFKPNPVMGPATPAVFSRATAASGPDVAKTSESTRSVVPATADEPVQFKPNSASEPTSVAFSRATAPTENFAKTAVPTQLIVPTQVKPNPVANPSTPTVISRATAASGPGAPKTAVPTQRIVPTQFKPNPAAKPSTPVVFSNATSAPEPGATKATASTQSGVLAAANVPAQLKPNQASEPTSVAFSRATAPTEDFAKTAVPTQLIVPVQFKPNPAAKPSAPVVFSDATAASGLGAVKTTESTRSAVAAAADEPVQYKPNPLSEPTTVVFSGATAATEDRAKTAVPTQRVVPTQFNPVSEPTSVVFSGATAPTEGFSTTGVPAEAKEPIQFKPNPAAKASTPVVVSDVTAAPEHTAAKTTETLPVAKAPVPFKPNSASEPTSVAFSGATAPTEDLAKTAVPTQRIVSVQFQPDPASQPTSVVVSDATVPTEGIAKTAVPTQFKPNPAANPATPGVVSGVTAAPERTAAKTTETPPVAKAPVPFKPNPVVKPQATDPVENTTRTSAPIPPAVQIEPISLPQTVPNIEVAKHLPAEVRVADATPTASAPLLNAPAVRKPGPPLKTGSTTAAVAPFVSIPVPAPLPEISLARTPVASGSSSGDGVQARTADAPVQSQPAPERPAADDAALQVTIRQPAEQTTEAETIPVKPTTLRAIAETPVVPVAAAVPTGAPANAPAHVAPVAPTAPTPRHAASEAAAPRSAAAEEPLVKEREKALKSVSLEFTPDGAGDVRLRVTERAGEVQISLHTSDPALSGRIHEGVHDLVGSLTNAGYDAEAWTPDQGGGRQQQEQQPQEDQSRYPVPNAEPGDEDFNGIYEQLPTQEVS